MPIYEYACEQCQHHMEVLQGMNDPPRLQCENCQQNSLIRLLSASGFRLKGGGWYETDFKTKADKQKNLVSDASSAALPTPSASATTTPAKTGVAGSTETGTAKEAAPKTSEKPKATVDKSSTTE